MDKKVNQSKKALLSFSALKGTIVFLVTVLLVLLLASITQKGVDIVRRVADAGHVTERSNENPIEIMIDEPSEIRSLMYSISGTDASVERGQNIEFTLKFTGDVKRIYFSAGSVVLNGFFAHSVKVEQIGPTSIKIVCYQIDTLDYDAKKRIDITGGVAISSTGALSPAISSSSFYIHEPAWKQILNWIYEDRNYWTTLLSFFIAVLSFLYSSTFLRKSEP